MSLFMVSLPGRALSRTKKCCSILHLGHPSHPDWVSADEKILSVLFKSSVIASDRKFARLQKECCKYTIYKRSLQSHYEVVSLTSVLSKLLWDNSWVLQRAAIVATGGGMSMEIATTSSDKTENGFDLDGNPEGEIKILGKSLASSKNISIQLQSGVNFKVKHWQGKDFVRKRFPSLHQAIIFHLDDRRVKTSGEMRRGDIFFAVDPSWP